MNILIYFREKNYGGVHTYLSCHIPFFIKNGHNVYVTYAKESTKTAFEALGAQTFYNGRLRRKINLVRDAKEVLRTVSFIKKNDIDCVFSHTSKGGAIARVAALLARTPKVIHTVHGFAFHDLSSKKAQFVYSHIEKFLAYFTTRIICVNTHDKNIAILNKIVNPDRITTIFNGVRVPKQEELFTPEQQREFIRHEGLPQDRPVALFVGRLDVQKNPLFLINAFAGLQTASSLVMVGTGPLTNDCKRLIAEKGLRDKVYLMGFRNDVYNWYQVANIYILPSLWEGMPLTLLEAMGCKTLCIATDVRGNCECITDGHDGILVPHDNEELLRQKMDYYLNNHQISCVIATSAREKVIKHHSLEKMCTETLQVITNSKA